MSTVGGFDDPVVARWQRTGHRVRVAPLTAADAPALRRAIELSHARLAKWGPTGLDTVDALVDAQGWGVRTLLIHALDSVRVPGEHGIVGRVNLNHIVHGRLGSATFGYDAYDPYAGRGLMGEGLRLVVDVALDPSPDGLGLHRVEAGVQPANVRSAGLLRSVGFGYEGRSPRLVHLVAAGDPVERWRDHDRYAVTVEDWPALPYRAAPAPRHAVLVSGIPGSGKSTLAARLAAELGMPLLRKDAVKEAVADGLPTGTVLPGVWADSGDSGDSGVPLSRALGVGASEAIWRLLAESPVGGVVESWFWPHDRDRVIAGLNSAGFDPAAVLEVFCEVPIELAQRREADRRAAGLRHRVHREVSASEWTGVVAPAAHPLALGPVWRVDTSTPVPDAEVTRIALRVRAGTSGCA